MLKTIWECRSELFGQIVCQDGVLLVCRLEFCIFHIGSLFIIILADLGWSPEILLDSDLLGYQYQHRWKTLAEHHIHRVCSPLKLKCKVTRADG